MPKSRYQVVEVTDLRTRIKTFKIFERPAGSRPPIVIGIATREVAEAIMQEMEAEARR